MLKGWHGQPAVYKSTAGTDVADCMLLNGRSPKDRRTARQCLFVSELNLCTTLSPIPSRFKAKMSVPRPLQSLPTLSDCFRSLMAKAAMAVGSGNIETSYPGKKAADLHSNRLYRGQCKNKHRNDTDLDDQRNSKKPNNLSRYILVAILSC